MRDENAQPGLARTLTSRHIQFIAIGGAIGAGLFLGSGSAIKLAGPGAILAYIVSGIAIYIMARALGELILQRPDATSFIDHVETYLGRGAGFVTGWSYFLLWILMGMVESTAIAVLLRFWIPEFPQWVAAFITLALLYLLNRTAVRVFGETEFWLTLVKVLAILALIGTGAVMAILHLGPAGEEARFSNLWAHGGFLPNGIASLAPTMAIALFAFGATEMIGVTAAEAADPSKTVPRAINAVIFRIIFFYVGSLLIVMSVAPWTVFGPAVSPFVLVFERAGFDWAASAVNLVVISAVLSSCNSGIFATGRMLYSLAQAGDAPVYFTKLSSRQLPVRAISASALAMAFGVVLNYLFPEEIFSYLLSVVAALLIWTWSAILLAHARYRRSRREAVEDRPAFRLSGSPATNYLALLFMGGVFLMMSIDEATRPVFVTAVIWFALIGFVSLWHSARRKRLPSS